tara:strand:- start:4047 stop:4241 length:195 start_codon:yes stop_codon:yes gene_type:complete
VKYQAPVTFPNSSFIKPFKYLSDMLIGNNLNPKNVYVKYEGRMIIFRYAVVEGQLIVPQQDKQR